MEEKEITMQEEQKTIPLFRIITKRWLLIALITILCGLLSVGYSILMVKPTYTAKQSVIFRASVGEETLANQVTTNVTLAKTYLPDVVSIVKSPAVIKKANEGKTLAQEKVSSGAISISYGEDSLIFTISYTDLDNDSAISKLTTVIETASSLLPMALEAESVALIPTQNDYNVSVNSGYAKHVTLGIILGIIIGLGISVLMYIMDNTITDKIELEQITGTDVLSQVNSRRDLGKK